MGDYVFDIPAFRVNYPLFANSTQYPDLTLQTNWDIGTCYIANRNYGYLSGDCRYRALTLITAHITALSDKINAGKVPGLVQGSTVDKVSITLTPPPLPNQFLWWLSLTGYGQQLAALLSVKAVGGFYVGGWPESSSFRKAGGFFV